MSDVVIVALIGIVASPLAAILGAVVTGRIQGSNVERQLNARRDEQRSIHEHQSLEAQIGRLIEVRKGYLIPLRETMNKRLASSQAESLALGRLTAAERVDDEKRIVREREYLMTQMDSSQAAVDDLNEWRGQVSDDELDRLIQVVEEAHQAQATDLIEIAMVANDSTASLATREANLTRFRDLVQNAWASARLVNKRIEELLSGIE